MTLTTTQKLYIIAPIFMLLFVIAFYIITRDEGVVNEHKEEQQVVVKEKVKPVEQPMTEDEELTKQLEDFIRMAITLSALMAVGGIILNVVRLKYKW